MTTSLLLRLFNFAFPTNLTADPTPPGAVTVPAGTAAAPATVTAGTISAPEPDGMVPAETAGRGRVGLHETPRVPVPTPAVLLGTTVPDGYTAGYAFNIIRCTRCDGQLYISLAARHARECTAANVTPPAAPEPADPAELAALEQRIARFHAAHPSFACCGHDGANLRKTA